MMKTTSRKASRLWVGIKFYNVIQKRSIFRYIGEPTKESHPEFSSAVGPFRTKAGAEYFAAHFYCENVAKAERMAKLHKSQSELCAMAIKNLDSQKIG